MAHRTRGFHWRSGPALASRTELLRGAAETALTAMDPEPARDGLRDTPRRWATMMADLTNGHEFNLTTFPNEGYDEMVVQTGITLFSLCEHHLVPWFGVAAVGYIPGKRIVGLSKLSRVVEHFSRSLQVQERLTQQVAALLNERLQPRGVGVLVRARHLCQEMRGIRRVGAETVTCRLTGVMRRDGLARSEFLALARGG